MAISMSTLLYHVKVILVLSQQQDIVQALCEAPTEKIKA